MIKHLKIKNFILLISFSILITSCKYQDIAVGEIQSVDLNKINKEKIIINILIPVKNPNNYKIKIKDYDIDIDINGQNFEVLELDNKIIITKRYDGLITVPVSLSKKGIISFKTIRAVYQILSKKKIHIKAKGYVNVKVLFITKKIIIDEKRTIKLKGNK